MKLKKITVLSGNYGGYYGGVHQRVRAVSENDTQLQFSSGNMAAKEHSDKGSKHHHHHHHGEDKGKH
jgi:hypothetical protein